MRKNYAGVGRAPIVCWLKVMNAKLIDIAGQITLYGFFFTACATPIAVLALAILRFIQSDKPRYGFALKGLAALLIWGVLTFVVISLFIVIVFSVTYDQASREAVDLKMTIVFALVCWIYALAGGGLVYWVQRRAKRQS
jgi:hypothetical protein